MAVPSGQRRELPPQAVSNHLEEPLRTTQVPQVVFAEIQDRHTGREEVVDQLHDRARHQHLPAVSQAHEARAAVEGQPEVVPVHTLRRTGVDAHADSQRRPG